jgi:ubiquinone/menaquinone biosynthesis C-methylase UbiE
VNIDARQLARAEAEIAAQQGNRVTWIEADACRLPLADAAFDVVLAVECIMHFPHRGEFLQQAARVLRPGGRLALSDFLPPAKVLPYLVDKAFNPLCNESTQRTYGRIDVLTPLEEYRRLGETAGLRLTAAADLTHETLPTYAFLRSHVENWKDPGLARHFDEATARLEAASRKGFLLYQILAFTKS